MHRNRTRTTAITGATMALVLAGTAAVSAHGGDRNGPPDDGFFGMGGAMGRMMDGGARGSGGHWGLGDDVERQEVSIQTADGITVNRLEQGAVDVVSDTAITFSLASGESVTVAIDADTDLYGLEEQEMTTRGGWSRTVTAPTDITTADIAAGDEVVVWSSSEDGVDFVASRIVAQPPNDTMTTADDGAAAGDSAAAGESPAASDAVNGDAASDA